MKVLKKLFKSWTPLLLMLLVISLVFDTFIYLNLPSVKYGAVPAYIPSVGTSGLTTGQIPYAVTSTDPYKVSGSSNVSYNGTTGALKVASLNATAAASTTLVTNLNADLLDGQHSSYFAPVDSPTFTGTAVAPTANITTLNAHTGRGATFVIAGTGVPTNVTSQADNTTSGTNDDLAVQNAIDTIVNSGTINSATIVLQGDFNFSNTVTLDLAPVATQKRISVIGNNAYITLSGVAGTAAFSIINYSGANYADYYAPVISNLTIDGGSASAGRIGISYSGSTVALPLSGLLIKNTASGIKGVPSSNQLEALILSDSWFTYNTKAIDFPDYPTATASFEESIISGVRVNVPANSYALYAGDNISLGRSDVDMMIWLLGDNAIGIYSGCGLNYTMLKLKVESVSGAWTGRKAISIGPNFVTGQTIRAEFQQSLDAVSTWLYNPSGKVINIVDAVTPQLGITSMTNANLYAPVMQPAANQGIWWYDYSGNYNNILLTGSPTWTTMGKLGAITLDGATQYGKVSSASFMMDGDRYFVALIKTNFASTVGTDQYLAMWKLDASNYMSLYYNGSSSAWYLEIDGAGTAKGVMAASRTFASGAIFVIAATITASTGQIELFVNGKSEGTASAIGAIPATSGTMHIGSHDNEVTGFGAEDIAFVASGNYLLSANEVKSVTQTLADLANSSLLFKNSGADVSSGSQQTVAHGLGFTPTKQQIGVFSDNVSVMVWQSAAPDVTNIYVSANATSDGSAVTGSAWHWATMGN